MSPNAADCENRSLKERFQWIALTKEEAPQAWSEIIPFY